MVLVDQNMNIAGCLNNGMDLFKQSFSAPDLVTGVSVFFVFPCSPEPLGAYCALELGSTYPPLGAYCAYTYFRGGT